MDIIDKIDVALGGAKLNEGETVSWNIAKLKTFKKAYAKALKDKVESFDFEGNEYIPQFAKYLIEFLESQLKGK